MSTFERVRAMIMKDIDSASHHTADSWANIMLQNTARLTNPVEQRKFWDWVANPEDEDGRAKCTFETLPPTKTVDFQPTIKIGDETYNQEIYRNGMSCLIKVSKM